MVRHAKCRVSSGLGSAWGACHIHSGGDHTADSHQWQQQLQRQPHGQAGVPTCDETCLAAVCQEQAQLRYIVGTAHTPCIAGKGCLLTSPTVRAQDRPACLPARIPAFVWVPSTACACSCGTCASASANTLQPHL